MISYKDLKVIRGKLQKQGSKWRVILYELSQFLEIMDLNVMDFLSIFHPASIFWENIKSMLVYKNAINVKQYVIKLSTLLETEICIFRFKKRKHQILTNTCDPWLLSYGLLKFRSQDNFCPNLTCFNFF